MLQSIFTPLIKSKYPSYRYDTADTEHSIICSIDKNGKISTYSKNEAIYTYFLR